MVQDNKALQQTLKIFVQFRVTFISNGDIHFHVFAMLLIKHKILLVYLRNEMLLESKLGSGRAIILARMKVIH